MVIPHQECRRIVNFFLACTAMLVAAVGSLTAADQALPRVAVQHGQFQAQGASEVFHPRGFNYIIVGPHPEDAKVKWHHVFHPAKYDRILAEADLSTIAAHGFNTVRIFLDHTPGRDGGLGPNGDGAQLHPQTMENILDFLEIARRHRVYVLVTTCYLPKSNYYNYRADERVDQLNAYYLNLDAVSRKAEYVAQIASAVKARDPSLLSTILAWDFENEATFHVSKAPFFDRPKHFSFQGADYDLSTSVGAQSLMDAAIVNWINTCTAALRGVDPGALVTSSVFLYGHVGRSSGPGRIWEQVSDKAITDGRVPGRPLAIVSSKADFIQLHTYMYPTGNTYLNTTVDAIEQGGSDLFASIEFEALRKALRKSGKPLFCGEFGIDERWLSSPADGTAGILGQVDMLTSAGFSGYLLWTYGTFEPDRWLHATADDGRILKAMETQRVVWGTLERNPLPQPMPWLYDHQRPKDATDQIPTRRLNFGAPAAVAADGAIWYPVEAFNGKDELFPVQIQGKKCTSGIDRVRSGTTEFAPGATWVEGVRGIKAAVKSVSTHGKVEQKTPTQYRLALYFAQPGGVRPRLDGAGLSIEVNGTMVAKLDLGTAIVDRGCLRVDVSVTATDWIDLRFIGPADIRTPPLAALLIERMP